MITATIKVTSQILGRSFSVDQSVDSDNAIPFEPAVAAAKAGTLTTRGSNTAGTLTLGTGHGVLTGARIDLYWVVAGTQLTAGMRRGVVVGTVATNSVPISGGSGDNLPLLNAAIKVSVPNEEAVVVDGDNVVYSAVQGLTNSRCNVVLAADDNTELQNIPLDAGESYIWSSLNGVTNPLTGLDVAKAFISHEDVNASQTPRGVLGYN